MIIIINHHFFTTYYYSTLFYYYEKRRETRHNITLNLKKTERKETEGVVKSKCSGSSKKRNAGIVFWVVEEHVVAFSSIISRVLARKGHKKYEKYQYTSDLSVWWNEAKE